MKNSKNVKSKSEQQPAFSLLSLSLIDKSTFNPRKTFSEGELAELAESIKAQGVIQPIVVRPFGERYEVVCGERRYRASLLAGVETIPACIRLLSDEDAEEFAITENLQRKDVLPLEEARAFNRLVETKKYDIASLVKRFGKSDVFVRSRIKLIQLIEPFQVILEKEEMNLGVANVLANYSVEVQENVYNEHFSENVMSYYSWANKRANELQTSIDNAYSTKLGNKYFDKSDCEICAFNTANFTLFSEGNDCGMCTKRSCLAKKNSEYIISQALLLQKENPTLSFCAERNSDNAALETLSESGIEILEVRLANISNETPIAPIREDFEDESEYEEAKEEYQEELNEFQEEKIHLEQQIVNGELLQYIKIGQTGAEIAYATKSNVEMAHSILDGEVSSKDKDIQKLKDKESRNVELCGEKIRENLKETLRKIEITGAEISHLEETLKYFFMIIKMRASAYSLIGLDKKLYNLEYTDLLELTEEQKAIITREYIVSHLNDMFISSRKIKENNPLRAFMNQHAPDEVTRIDTEQELIYSKRNARLAERVQAITDEVNAEKLPKQLNADDNSACTLIDKSINAKIGLEGVQKEYYAFGKPVPQEFIDELLADDVPEEEITTEYLETLLEYERRCYE